MDLHRTARLVGPAPGEHRLRPWGVDIVAREDDASGVRPEGAPPMSITEMMLRPRIRARGTDAATLQALVAQARDRCVVANSLRSTITIEPECEILD